MSREGEGRGDRDAPPEAAEPPDEHRLSARRFYLAAPPFRIQHEPDGTFSVWVKHYAYYDDLPPERATGWRVLSRHADFVAAEDRLKHACSAPLYYDATGSLTRAPTDPDALWNLPPDD